MEEKKDNQKFDLSSYIDKKKQNYEQIEKIQNINLFG